MSRLILSSGMYSVHNRLHASMPPLAQNLTNLFASPPVQFFRAARIARLYSQILRILVSIRLNISSVTTASPRCSAHVNSRLKINPSQPLIPTNPRWFSLNSMYVNVGFASPMNLFISMFLALTKINDVDLLSPPFPPLSTPTPVPPFPCHPPFPSPSVLPLSPPYPLTTGANTQL